MKFFYQLKTLVPESCGSSPWEVIWFGVVEAADKKAAKQLIQEDHGGTIAEKVSRGSGKIPDYRLFLVDLDDHYATFWLSERTCVVCQRKDTILGSRQLGDARAGYRTCSNECRSADRKPGDLGYFEERGQHKPTIYKITNKLTGRCYVGKTTQPFTLRWWQHFFSPTETKFHQAIKESTAPDWTFEVIEVIDGADPKKIAEREQYWIQHFDAIESGYNSVKSCELQEAV